MPEESSSTERKRNLWAPWRIEYIAELSEAAGECFLCRYSDDAANDRRNLVLWRGRHCFVVMNRFPYTGGHCLIAPLRHVGELDALDDATLLELMSMLRDGQKALARAMNAEGFNIGLNIGRCAGAGLPGHLHLHLVPRWGGDTNFMHVLGDVRVIPQSLEALYDAIKQSADELKLPGLAGGG